MKADEAIKFICPVSMSGGKPVPCKGHECAGWRWIEPKFGSVDRRRGYCGMAGEPKYPLNPENENQL